MMAHTPSTWNYNSEDTWWSNNTPGPYINYTVYKYKTDLLYRDRAGFTPKLREYMNNIIKAIYSNSYSDRTINIKSTNSGVLRIEIKI